MEIKETLERDLSWVIKKFKIAKTIRKTIAIVAYEIRIDVINVKDRE